MFKSISLYICFQFVTPVCASNLDEARLPLLKQHRNEESNESKLEVVLYPETKAHLNAYLLETSTTLFQEDAMKEYVVAAALKFSKLDQEDSWFYEAILAKLILEGNFPQLSKSKALKKLKKLSSYYWGAAYVLGQYFEGNLLNCKQRLLCSARRYYIHAQVLGCQEANTKIMKINNSLVPQTWLKKKSQNKNEIEYSEGFKKNCELLANRYSALLNNKQQELSRSFLSAEAIKGNEVAIGFWISYLADHPEKATQEQKLLVTTELVDSLFQLLELDSDQHYISYIIGKLLQKNLIKGKEPEDAKPYLERAASMGYEPALFALVEYLDAYEKKDSLELQEKYLQMAIEKDYSPAMYKQAQILESRHKWSKNTKELRSVELLYKTAAKFNNAAALLRLAQLRQRAKKNAIPIYVKAAKLGSEEAQFYLGLMYWDGVGVTKSIEHAKYWFEMAGSQNHTRSLFYLGELMIKEYNDDESAIKYFKQAAENNLVQAMYRLAQIYINGIGIKQNINEAILLLSKAAKAGHLDAKKQLCRLQNGSKTSKINIDFLTELAKWGCADAQFELSWCYYNGVGVKKNDEVSMDWLQMAASYRHPAAMYELGWKYHKGVVVAKNAEISTKWFVKAAEASHVGAMYALARRYAIGEGLSNPDKYNAMKWFKQASFRGHTRATYHLACRYAAGEIVKKDVQKALELFLICLKKGYFQAIYPLWELCIKYETELKHNSEVVEWLTESALFNNPTSQCFLADIYFRGAFVQQDTENAIYWYHKSANAKNTIALTRLGDIYNYVQPCINKSMQFYETAAMRGSHFAQQRLNSHFDSVSLVHKVNTLTRYMPQIEASKLLNPLNLFEQGRLKLKKIKIKRR